MIIVLAKVARLRVTGNWSDAERWDGVRNDLEKLISQRVNDTK